MSTRVLVWIVVILLVIAGVWYVWNRSQAATPSTNTVATSTSDILPGVSNETYTNQHLSFSIEYPSNATVTSDFSSGFLPLTQTPVVAIELPKSMFSGTNLGEAGVYIGATTTPDVMTACTNAMQGETAVANVTIGGQTFFAFTSTDAAAGNIYQEKTFRTFQNGSCFEIVELLHSGNINNYTAGSVQEFDQNLYFGILDSIVQTYYPIPTGQ